jgi:hypothetical protein
MAEAQVEPEVHGAGSSHTCLQSAMVFARRA